MDYKVTLQIWNANSKEEAMDAVNEMLDAYDFHCKKVKENPEDEDEIEINWAEDSFDWDALHRDACMRNVASFISKHMLDMKYHSQQVALCIAYADELVKQLKERETK